MLSWQPNQIKQMKAKQKHTKLIIKKEKSQNYLKWKLKTWIKADLKY